MIRFYDKPQREYEEEVALLENEDEVYKLVLHNDDVFNCGESYLV